MRINPKALAQTWLIGLIGSSAYGAPYRLSMLIRAPSARAGWISACHAKYLGIEITVAITLALRHCPESTQRHCGQVEIPAGQSLSLQAIAARKNVTF